jgi:transcriptional regulator with PAS, ATPase and Fis domain
MSSDDIVFASEAMELAVEIARAVAPTASPVLVEGESGTGKELIARLIHTAGARSHKPFVAVNCGAVPETLFESEFFGYKAGAFTGALRDKPGILEIANGGTLFLDEIGDLSVAMQAKCLRVLQEKELRRVGDTKVNRIDIRLISATNKDLEHQMKTGRFREDLFYRISVLRIELAPLRERKEDIPVLCRHFSMKHCARLGKKVPRISNDVMELLSRYLWPGNVRQLENEIHRLVALSQDGLPITLSQVSDRIMKEVRQSNAACPAGHLKARLASYERELIREALERYGWNKTRVARHLGLTRQGLHRKLLRLRIERSEQG